MIKDDKRHPTKAPKAEPRSNGNGPEEARQKALAEEIMDEDREVLRELAK